MDFYKEIVCMEISNKTSSLSELGDLIWKLAEVGYEAQRSCEAICKFFEKNKFKVTRNVKGIKSTFIAEYGEAKKGTKTHANVAILCRYDAVSKKGHTKGTNLTAEAAVAAALGLKAVISSTADTLGKVTVIGCPNQEGGGVVHLMRLRVFRGLDILLTAAPGRKTEWFPRYMSSTSFKAWYYGKEGDPSKTQPTTNAMDASFTAYTNMLAMQEHFGRGWKAAGHIEQPGSIWVDRHLCQTTVRLDAPCNTDFEVLQKRILSSLRAAAEATGCEVTINHGGKTIHSLISNTQLGYLIQLNAYHCGVLATPKKRREVVPPVDVAEVSRHIPTIRPLFYIGTDATPGTEEFKKASNTKDAHRYAQAMAKALAMTAIDVLHTPDMLAKVQTELKNSLDEECSFRFAPFPTKAPEETRYIIKMEVPGDYGAVGWSRQGY